MSSIRLVFPTRRHFRRGANRIYTFLDLGTRGWLSDRLNTHVAVRYDQDLTHVNIGSPAADINEVSPANRRLELLDANAEVNFKPSDGLFANTSIQFGRVNIYGAEIASLDGGAFTLHRPKFDLTFYGGRRFALFSDPEQRGIGGANLLLRLGEDTTLALETLWYIRGINKATFRHRFNPRWVLVFLLPVVRRSAGGFRSPSGV